MPRHSPARRRVGFAGFTLIELLVVLIILGILAALAIPSFSNATTSAKSTSLRDQLRQMRSQIEFYRFQHGGTAPGFPGGNSAGGATETALIEQLTAYTNAHGQVSLTPSKQYPYGPYLNKVPVNPFNDSATFHMLGGTADFPTEPSGEYGWIYQASTGRLGANTPGVDLDGVKYMDY